VFKASISLYKFEDYDFKDNIFIRIYDEVTYYKAASGRMII